MGNKDFYNQKTLPYLYTDENLDIEIPKKIGPYNIDGVLHKGSMSMLFLGTDSKTNKTLTIKILSPKFISHKEMVNQFLEEAKIIGMTNHPNIVKLYGQGKWAHGLYIAMEFVQGISLKQFIVGQSISLTKSLDIILQVSYALLHLHTHKVIHRDLKPENILITELGKIKVIDFGISQLIDEASLLHKESGGIIGTPSYMSPEQKLNPLTVTFNTDIYSLAVVAYELILGRLSFGNIQLELLPNNLRPILEKALSVDKNKRTNDIVDFISEISNYIKSDGIGQDCKRDELKEVLEDLSGQYNALLPKELPTWPEVEIGLGKFKGVYIFGTYYDFFKFPDGSMAIILIESVKQGVLAITDIATFRGIIRSTITPFTRSANNQTFNCTQFASQLNEIFYNEPHSQNEMITILHLYPLINLFAFVSSGFESLWHLPYNNNTPHMITNDSSMIGKELNQTFFPTKVNWNIGDLIILHSFSTQLSPKNEQVEINKKTSDHLTQYKHLSPVTLAESTLLSIKEISKNPHNQTQKLVFAISRIV